MDDSTDVFVENLIVFVFSLIMMIILISLILCLKKYLEKKMPNTLKNTLNKIKAMLMYNSVCRFLILSFQAKLLDAVVTMEKPD